MHLITFTQVLYLSMIFNFYFHYMLICISLNHYALSIYLFYSLPFEFDCTYKTAQSVNKIWSTVIKIKVQKPQEAIWIRSTLSNINIKVLIIDYISIHKHL